ncbi:MAG: hypothetical protein E7672_01670 [Ruminococcaceae bacterium]|nr:hypothetical protein [Oscillospiraceae bacterium]
MHKKKNIIAAIFLVLIALTVIFTVVSAVKSYQYDMDPANGVDIFEGLGAVLTMMVGGFVVLYELDLFYTVYYFFVKPKTVAKSILNILSNLSLLLVFFGKYYKNIFGEDVIAPLIVLFTYVVFRLVYIVVSKRDLAR